MFCYRKFKAMMLSRKYVRVVVAAIMLTVNACAAEEEGSTSGALQAAVQSAFDEQLRQQVLDSCVKHTEAVLATAKSNVLHKVMPFSESCDSAKPSCVECSKPNNEEFFDLMNTGKMEWRMAFRGTADINKSVFSAYQDGTLGVNTEPGCKQINFTATCTHHYRNNDVLDNWENIDEVAFVLFNKGTKVRQIIFDAAGTNYMDWFQESKVKSSSWKDLATVKKNFFSIAGDGNVGRRFFINANYASCPNDSGWFVAIDKTNAPCPWASRTTFPFFKYSNQDTVVNWTSGNFGYADVMAVFVKYHT